MEKCPGGTVESIAFLRQNINKKEEEEGWRIGSEKGGSDADEQREEKKIRLWRRRPSIARRQRRDKRLHEETEKRSRRAAPQ
ncbi:hypothetical protein NDU88_005774 [Pleurodeles waltl]|uniref:Uncharacterized protein n=1 Tax=Pleurodeles waltl TaxID=8319 RepID=A0AAV7WZM3_PLEWA|nr:hypothetical protein NDU88_005774 [Pleurodeles waltl]